VQSLGEGDPLTKTQKKLRNDSEFWYVVDVYNYKNENIPKNAKK